ncbi:hypothetical protein ACIHDR_46830 [Nocardia sp. NPDC052278]|uniref:hypothetical protein n=1 Tax=unclassified Nocardia TaxID=2637762 RepID=UPI0036AE95A8
MTIATIAPLEVEDLDFDDATHIAPALEDSHPDLEPAGRTFYINPDLLVRAPNRPEKPRSDDFNLDIAENGNYVPIVVSWRRSDNRFEVEDGWHRTLALRDAKRRAWIAVLPPDLTEDQKQKVIDRVGRQFSTGKFRFDQTEADRLCAAAMLFDVNVSQTTVRKRLGMTKQEVKAAKVIAKSPAATAAVNAHQLNILHAGMAEERFGHDPDAMRALIDAEQRGEFEHLFAELVEEQELLAAQQQAEIEAAATAERLEVAYNHAVEDFTGRGFTVLADEPDFDDPGYRPLGTLVTADGVAPTEQDVIEHPERFAVVLIQHITHAETGELIDPADVDEHTGIYPDADPDVGCFHVRDVIKHEKYLPRYLCIDLDAAGLSSIVEPDDDQSGDNVGRSINSNSESIEARSAREEKEAADARAKAAANDRTKKLNVKSRSTTKVRRSEVIKKWFTERKTIDPGMLELIGMVNDHPELLNRFAAAELVKEFGKQVPATPSSDGVKARDNHGGLRAALRAVAAVEADIVPNLKTEAATWRRRRNPLWAAYFRLLETSLDYKPQPYEKILTGELTPDQVLAGLTEAPAPKAVEEIDSVDADDPEADSGVESLQDRPESTETLEESEPESPMSPDVGDSDFDTTEFAIGDNDSDATEFASAEFEHAA